MADRSSPYNGLEQLAVRTLTVGGTDLTHFVHDRFGNVIAESNGTGPSGTLREYIWLPEAEIAPTFKSRAKVVSETRTTSAARWRWSRTSRRRPLSPGSYTSTT